MLSNTPVRHTCSLALTSRLAGQRAGLHHISIRLLFLIFSCIFAIFLSFHDDDAILISSLQLLSRAEPPTHNTATGGFAEPHTRGHDSPQQQQQTTRTSTK
ncbi:hypothetical protein E2C01_097763 [Portunus trituberculatus]|uniref:Uncharacterized protein n=1 Tax=Portunus trituberculatus TaxID=210409 RepID=A0A5B7KAE7_PORTR|nr:hypothetical protein [Portunus trituberculatus]